MFEKGWARHRHTHMRTRVFCGILRGSQPTITHTRLTAAAAAAAVALAFLCSAVGWLTVGVRT